MLLSKFSTVGLIVAVTTLLIWMPLLTNADGVVAAEVAFAKIFVSP